MRTFRTVFLVMDKTVAPIGLFDSGVGGTTIWKEVIRILPNESTIYFADSLHAPYGPKGKETIQKLSARNTEFLIHAGCKIIVVACNTATTNAIGMLREKYPVPFIGIEPAIKPATLHTRSGKVGVLATRGTLSSALFHQTAHRFASGIEILEQHGDGLVELIEAGMANSSQTLALLQKYLLPMVNAGADVLVLGCTHYPILMPQLREILPPHIQIIDSGEAVAKQTKRVLEESNLLNTSKKQAIHKFLCNQKETLNFDLLSEIPANIDKFFVNIEDN